MKNNLIYLALVLLLIACNSEDDNLKNEENFNFEIEEIYSVSQNRAFAKINSNNNVANFQLKLHKAEEENLSSDTWFDADLNGINPLCYLDPETNYEVTIFANLDNQEIEGNTLSFTTKSLGTDNVTEIVEITNPITGRTWMDRNLGAQRSAVSSSDNRAFGDYYQWGRRADGHEKKNSNIVNEQANSVQPEHGNFIAGFATWNTIENSTTWDGVDAINNPCPCGFRLPTPSELAEEINSWSTQNANGAIQSVLKLPLPGYRGNADGVVSSEALFGYYWSSTNENMNGKDMGINQSSSQVTSHAQAGGASIRCIKNQ
ncbi:fibrobacter succinogenes major paralogous domain-containing protein [Psychroflexus aestuariivivens]|uniref:FISUMP domain-containing protein n=1 Tax=Psychroflexus aestuariivivens TaxID=1795040 RepID=UPI000FD7341D|nr:FISUMP domain-containing protein [Psychroflexus aestuariivivens]